MKTMASNMTGKLPQKMSHNRRLDSSTILTPIKKSPGEISPELFNCWCRGTESNCRHGDFQTTILKIENCRNFKQLILFQFFN